MSMRTRKRRLGCEATSPQPTFSNISFMEEVNYTMEAEEEHTGLSETKIEIVGGQPPLEEGFKKKLRRYSSIHREVDFLQLL